MNVLVIVAHPDDEVLGCGGTIAKHAEDGDEICLVVVCESFSARYGVEMREKLENSARESASMLGIKSTKFLSFPNIRSNKVPIREIVDAIDKILREKNPDTVYVHHHGDINIDHRVVFNAAMLALRSFGGKSNIKQVMCFETPSSTEWSPSYAEYQFIPNVFVDITNTMGKKLKAMQFYTSEIRPYPHPRSAEALRLYAEHWGIKSGINNPTEAFELVRWCK